MIMNFYELIKILINYSGTSVLCNIYKSNSKKITL